MYQGENQYTKMNLQLFAEDADNEAPQEAESDSGPSDEPSQDTELENAPQNEEPDYTKLGEMNQSEQLDFLKHHGFTGEAPEEPQKEQPKDNKDESKTDEAPQEEQTYEITVDGEKRKLTLQELIAQAQMGADYTKKTQALAESRRQVDAMMAALQVRQAEQKPQEQPKAETSNDAYDDAVAKAEKALGLKAGEFNQFDPRHQFELNRIMMKEQIQSSRQTSEQSEVKAKVKDFVANAGKDPLSDEINNNFDVYLFRLGSTNQAGAQKAARIAEAKQRFFAGQASVKDCDTLMEHWNYVRGELVKAKTPKPEPPKPEPPKTEAPGTGRQVERRGAFDVHKLGSMTTQQQLRALKQLGIFDMPK